MITQHHLARLNRILGDKMGLIPAGYRESGQPRYQWKRSEELLFLSRTGTRTREGGTGLIVTVEYEPVYEWERQSDLDTWVIAQWNAPPPKLEWELRYASDQGWPADGFWFNVLAIRPDAEPSEEFCYVCADQMQWQQDLGFKKIVELMRERREKREKQQDDEIRARIDDVWVNHVPGKRGGVYSAPFSKFDT